MIGWNSPLVLSHQKAQKEDSRRMATAIVRSVIFRAVPERRFSSSAGRDDSCNTLLNNLVIFLFFFVDSYRCHSMLDIRPSMYDLYTDSKKKSLWPISCCWIQEECSEWTWFPSVSPLFHQFCCFFSLYPTLLPLYQNLICYARCQPDSLLLSTFLCSSIFSYVFEGESVD